MSIKAETLHQAEAELEFLRKTQVEKNEIRKKQFYKKFKRAKDIDLQLSRTAIDSAKAILSGASAKEKLTELKNKNLALQKELETLLITANLPLDYLNIKYKCADCKDMGYVDGVMCDCLKNLIKKITYKNLNKLSPLSLSTFEAFNTDLYPDKNSADGVNVKSHMEKIFNFCKNYANTFNKNSENLFLQGATGLGKTHLSLAIANSAINSGYNVIYTSTPNILSKLEKEHFSHNFKMKKQKNI